MLHCSEGCYTICDFCLFYDFNGDDNDVYIGKGVCWHPKHPERKSPSDGCNDFICGRVIE